MSHRRPTSTILIGFIGLAVSSFGAGSVQAHNVGAGLFGHTLSVHVAPATIQIDYVIEIPTPVLLKEFWEFLDQNAHLSVEDKDRQICSIITKRLVKGFLVIADGAIVPLEEVSSMQERTGFGDYNFFQYRVCLKGAYAPQGSSITLSVLNKNYSGFRGVYFTSLIVDPPYKIAQCSLEYKEQRLLIDAATGLPWSLWEGHRSVELKLREPRLWEGQAADSNKAVVDNHTIYAAQQKSGEAVTVTRLARRSDNATSRVATLLYAEELNGTLLLVALGMAVVLGGAHALSPGHGKSLVAAYLVGTRGRARDALVLAGIVTLTHVAVVLVLGVVTLLASQYFVPEYILPYIEIGSGVLIVGIGLFMVRSRWPRLHTHSDSVGEVVHRHYGYTHLHHDHMTHTHDMAAGHSRVEHGERPKMRELAMLGFSGGIVPCPSAIVIFLMAVALHKVVLGLCLIVCFSVGLAAVLTGIGIVVVRMGSSLMTRHGKPSSSGVMPWLPVLSGAAVSVIGIFIVLKGLSTSGTLALYPFGG